MGCGWYCILLDVTNPSDIKKIDSVQVDARTVNDVKVSQMEKLLLLVERASNRKMEL